MTDRWSAMDHWRDADIVRFQNDAIPVLIAAERRIVDTTVAYVAATQAASTGGPFRPGTPDYRELTGAALRGVDLDVLLKRPQAVLNFELSRGRSLTEAVTAGERRLRSIAGTDMQLAKTSTVAKHGKSKFYRRVLTGGENCALCVIASTQRYRRGTLAPIHPGCDCGIEELVDEQPPHVIAPQLLETTHTAIASQLGGTDRNAFDLGRAKKDAAGRPLSDFTDLIVARPHGELGPTLGWRGDHFRDAVDATGLAA